MKDKINVAELLKDCPKGMELDCTMFDGVFFDHVDDLRLNRIKCYVNNGNEHFEIEFEETGQYISNDSAKCVIFPKGKTTWEGFVPPCTFKDGDVVATDSGRWLGIIKNKYNSGYYTVHCAIDYTFNDIFYRCGEYRFSRLATEEEKQKLFQAIKANGYKWNTETKTLEKLVEPKFKVGDSIQSVRVNLGNIYNVIEVKESSYVVNKNNENSNFHIDFDIQDDWELVPDKFDLNTLVPFESRVLVRNDESQCWVPAFWGCKRTDGYTTTFGWCKYCIPFGGNEHLLGKTDDCDEHFKTWE